MLVQLSGTSKEHAHTDSAPDTAGVAEPSFFCFGFAFANELKILFFSFFGTVRSVDLAGGWVSLGFDGCEPAS